MKKLIFLKLGGSLITDKNKPHTPKIDIISRAAEEISSALSQTDNIKLLIGHGSGSFGHVPAKKFKTREGVFSQQDWRGLQEVWYQARALNQIVVDQLNRYGIPVISFPPSASIVSNKRRPENWNTDSIIRALDAGLVPLLNGDIIIDRAIGGTIYSTEELFLYLSEVIQPDRLLLAGIEPGVWEDFPVCSAISQEISMNTFHLTANVLQGSKATDVTGGMQEKVQIILDIIKQFPSCQGLIFSGLQPGNIKNALLGQKMGTLLRH